MKGTRELVQPSTQLYAPLNLDQMARDLRLEERAEQAGGANQPATDATEPDLAELDVLAAIQKVFRKAHEDYLAGCDLYEGRVRQAVITADQGTRIESHGESTLADFAAAIVNDQNHLHILRQEVEGREAEFKAFRSQHALSRLPRSVSGSGKVLLWMMLLMFLLLESILNGMLFAEGSEAGLIGGVVQALMLSALNVGTASLYALYGLPLVFVRRRPVRISGAIVMILFVTWVGTLNLTIGHFRDLFITNAGQVQMTDLVAHLLATPLALGDARSGLLVLLGGAVSLLTVIEVARSRDVYPGFTSVWTARESAIRRYATAKEKCWNGLIRVRDSAISDMNAAIDALRDAEYDAQLAVEGRSRLHNRYAAFLDDIAAGYERLVRVYREANERSRQLAPPAYFRRPIQRPAFLQAPTLEALPDVGKEVRQSVIDLMQHYIKAINEKFQAALPEYRTIAQLTSPLTGGASDA